MPVHVSEQIVQAAKSMLTGLPTTGANCFDSLVYPLQSTQLPAVLVDHGDESSEIAGKGSSIALTRTLELVVAAKMAQTASYRQTMNQIRLEVEEALAAPGAFGALCKYCIPKSLTVELDGEGEKPVASGTMKFEVVYYTAANAPDVPL